MYGMSLNVAVYYIKKDKKKIHTIALKNRFGIFIKSKTVHKKGGDNFLKAATSMKPKL